MEEKTSNGYGYIISAFAGLVLAILLMQTCENNNLTQLTSENKALKQLYQQKENELIANNLIRGIKLDSLQKEINKRDLAYQVLSFDFNEVNKKLKEVKDKPIVVPKDLNGLKEYYDTRYNTETAIIADNLALPEDTAKDVSYDLEEGDRCAEITQLQNEQIDIQTKQIDVLEKNNTAISSQLELTKESNNELKDLNEIGKKNINSLEKQVETLNNKSKFMTYFIPISFATGLIIGNQLAN